jgi:hypothetical protein
MAKIPIGMRFKSGEVQITDVADGHIEMPRHIGWSA